MKLLEFPHSHYCEKARWALDFKKIPFQVVTILPGFHLWTVRRYAPGTSVPVLLSDDQAVQGSSKIINFLENHSPAYPLTPEDDNVRLECLKLEKEMDIKLGLPIRQILYHRLLAYPSFVSFCFTHSLSVVKQFAFRLYYPVLRKKIYQTYVISDAEVKKGHSDFNKTMDTLAENLTGKSYLFNDRFSRADLTVSSMLSFLVMPEQHPFPWPEIPDPQIKTLQKSYSEHPVCIWVSKIYETHRPLAPK